MRYIYHHLGLGDHIICNGMVRNYYKQDNNIKLFCKNHNILNVKYMYRDVSNLELIPIDNDLQCIKYIKNNNIKDNIIKIGHEKCNKEESSSFDKDFYRIAGLDFSVRFNNFFIDRDNEKEEELINELNPNNEKFIFIHDDKSKGYNIDISKISNYNMFKIIYNDTRFLVFNYIKLIEMAEEVHFMQSSFKELICSYEFKKTKFYQHNYIRKYDSYMNSVGLNKIIEID
jgi:hypothetical protein